MPTTTSKIAYKEISTDGTASTQKQAIIHLMSVTNFPLSLREISEHTGFDINAVSGRVNELKKDAILETTSKRRCTITKRLINPVWLIDRIRHTQEVRER